MTVDNNFVYRPMHSRPFYVARNDVVIKNECGEKIIRLFGLKKQKDGRIDTAWGTKTPMGVFCTVERIYLEMTKGKAKLTQEVIDL